MKKIIVILVLFVLSAFPQGIADGVRLSKTQIGLDARSAALGISFQGLVDNSAALHFNPAGLSLIPSSELSFGVDVIAGHNDNVYLGNSVSSDFSSEGVQNAALVVPFKRSSNNLTFAFGYFNDNDFEYISNLRGVNNNNSYIDFLANRNDVIPSELFLANENNFTPIQDSVGQELRLFEEGNINRIVAGISLDINEKISIGFSGSARFGDFSQRFFLTERDYYSIYNQFSEDQTTVDWRNFTFERRINQSFQAVAATIGIVAKPTENSRLSFAFDVPQYVSVEDNARYDSYSEFDNGDAFAYSEPGNQNETFTTEYDIILPMKFRLGYSINLMGLTATVGAEYTDLNNLEFRSTQPFIEDYNILIPETLGAEFSWGMGIEWAIPVYPAFVRASYGETTNPWVDGRIDLGSTTNVGVGGGLLLGDNFMLDVTYNVLVQEVGRFLYNDIAQPFSLENTISNFVIGVTYRY